MIKKIIILCLLATPVYATGVYQTPYGTGVPTASAGNNMTAFGYNTIHAGAGSLGIDEVAFGAFALTADTAGLENTAIGDHALATLTNGSNNTALGSSAMANFNGYASTGLGVSAMQDATGGSYNVAIGNSSLNNVHTNGDDNVGIGRGAGSNITTGAQNVGIGYAALGGTSTGGQNTALGYGAGGSGITSGFGNTFLGAQTTATGNWSYSTAIGWGAQIGANHQIIIGTSSEVAVVPGDFVVGGNVTINGTCSGCGGGASPTAGPAFSAYGDTSGITDVTLTKATFTTEVYDTDSKYSSSRFTPNVAGIYHFTAQLFYYSIPSSPHRLLICFYKNGSEVYRGSDDEHTLQAGIQATADIHLNGTTDYVEVYTYQNTGSTQSTSNNSGINSYFQGFMARAD